MRFRQRLKGGNPLQLAERRAAWGARVMRECDQCKKPFEVLDSQATERRFCSWECRRAFGHIRPGAGTTKRDRFYPYVRITPEQRLANKIAKLERGLLSPSRTAVLRGEVATLMEEHIQTAAQVLTGATHWTPTQARVFATLLAKVLPDLSASHVQHEHTISNPTELSIEQLEAIAAGALRKAKEKEPEDVDCIDASPTSVEIVSLDEGSRAGLAPTQPAGDQP
jgi:hypothetical protein